MKLAVGLTFAAMLASSVPVQAEDQQDQERPPESLGFVEWIVLQDTGLRLKARLDTGAKTSSLHAVNIEPFEKGDEEWVSFQVPLADHRDQEKGENGTEAENVVLEFERPVDRTVLIKRKGAPSQRRYVVRMEFCIAGSTHETEFSLADRGRFSYPALLGRRFMSDDNILVTSSESFLAENKCEHTTLDELAQNGKNLAK
ncbi:hypothetical protein MARLIPOL_07324 [Marinobacter lipolyticus SM19]|uniref:Retropepsin-like aspartic endopeptidase domain-containing protein n=1 Tax=Marinobacter lipolyticus SM19 TaxID=1318628 RepID=R8B1U7_9GAMM|nr:RimK/LysX family protein [Marinobacter lipolyticus]EON92544.1 hypothetical protein MARLIPOL_07324 [Marinobacter lipolyticus SM19]